MLHYLLQGHSHGRVKAVETDAESNRLEKRGLHAEIGIYNNDHQTRLLPSHLFELGVNGQCYTRYQDHHGRGKTLWTARLTF